MLPGYGEMTAWLGAATTAGGFGLHTLQLLKENLHPLAGGALGVPRAPRCPGEGGAGHSRALIPLRPAARPGGGNPPSSSAGKARLT